MHEHLEREVKLGVWPGFRMPDLGGVAEGVTAVTLPDRRLETTYYDTPDVRLARSHITLRFRTGDESGWTLKMPAADGAELAGGLARRELGVAGDGRVVPDELSSMLTSWVRTSSLAAAARMRTLRRRVELLDAEGLPVAEVFDDEVSVMEGRRLALRFREVEVEIGETAPAGLLDAVVDRLRTAGAGPPDPTPKVIRALGPQAGGPPDLEVRRIGSSPSAGEVIEAGLAAAVLRILHHEPGVRSGCDPEDVHQVRVGTRRLRSDLRTFRPLVDAAWADGLREELRRLADPLGSVRDADVLLDRLRRQVEDCDFDDDEVADSLLLRLTAERARVRRTMLEALASARHAALLDRLVEAARAPVLLPEAEGPAAEVLPALVRQTWKQLQGAVEDAGSDPSDELLHRMRIRAKRCRYAVEVAAPAIGKPARRLTSAVADLQQVLGDHHDAVVAEAWLRAAAPELSAGEALVAGQLVAVQRAEAEAARQAWPSVWQAASKKKLRAWLAD